MNLTQEIKDLYTKNCKKFFKEIEETQINEKICYAHEIKGLILSKCPYYQNGQRVNAMPIKTSMKFWRG